METPSQAPTPILQVLFNPEDGGNLNFSAPSAIMDWISKEKNFWGWVLDPGSMATSDLRNGTQEFRTILQRLVSLYDGCGGDASRLNIQEVNIYFSQFRSAVGFHSNSFKAKILRQISTANGITSAAAAFCHLRGQTINLNDPQVFWGVTQYHLQSRGMTHDSNQILVKAFEESREEERKKFELVTDQAKKVVEDLNKAKTDSIELGLLMSKRYEVIKRWGNSRWKFFRKLKQNDIDAGITQLKQVEKTYTEHMHLSAPVQYWKEKASEHSSACATRGWTLLIYTSLASIGFVVSALFSWLHIKEAKEDTYPLLVAGLFISTILFWIGRILVRLYLSEVHLRMDAKQRITMVQTYLALVNDKKIEIGDRELILKPLFAPTSDGIVKDDAAPLISLASLLSARASG